MKAPGIDNRPVVLERFASPTISKIVELLQHCLILLEVCNLPLKRLLHTVWEMTPQLLRPKERHARFDIAERRPRRFPCENGRILLAAFLRDTDGQLRLRRSFPMPFFGCVLAEDVGVGFEHGFLWDEHHAVATFDLAGCDETDTTAGKSSCLDVVDLDATIATPLCEEAVFVGYFWHFCGFLLGLAFSLLGCCGVGHCSGMFSTSSHISVKVVVEARREVNFKQQAPRHQPIPAPSRGPEFPDQPHHIPFCDNNHTSTTTHPLPWSA